MQGDVMVFGPGWLGSYWDGSGHVAVVRDVGPGYVDIVEQNATSSGTDRFPMNGSRVTANGYTPLIGWLRRDRADAGRAGLSRRHRDTRRACPINPATWTSSGVAPIRSSTTSHTATRAGRPEPPRRSPRRRTPLPTRRPCRRWPDRSTPSGPTARADIWQVQSQSGFFGAETWLAPQELEVGAVAAGSAPAAISQAPGDLEVIWKATDGTLWAATYTGTLVGADAARTAVP